jgi:hypothetical protein
MVGGPVAVSPRFGVLEMRQASVFTRWLLLRSVTLLLLLVSSPLRSQPAVELSPVSACQQSPNTQCLLTFRNGGMLVGTIGGLLSGQRVQVRLSMADSREIPLADIVSAVPVNAPFIPVAQKPTANDTAPERNLIASVTLDGMQRGMKVQSLSEEQLWIDKCTYPCEGLKLPLGGSYRLTQLDGLSGKFELPLATRINLSVRPGVKSYRNLGIALVVIGSVASTVGVVAASGFIPATSSLRDQELLAGGVLLVVGGAMFGTGLALTLPDSIRVTAEIDQ